MPGLYSPRCHRLKSLPAILLLCASINCFAQGSGSSASEYFEDAVRYFNEGEYNTAVIQLKNALQQNPRLLPALVLLGRTYLSVGNPAAAEAAFNDALEAGADPSLVVIPRARSYMVQFKHTLLLAEEIPRDLPLNILAELHTIRAQAAILTNSQKTLIQELANAKAANPDDSGLLYLQTTVAIQKGNLQKADELLRRLTSLYPGQENTLLAKASINHTKGRLTAALDDYGAVISKNPNSIDARMSRVGILFDLGRHADAEEDLSFLSDRAGSDPRVSFLNASKQEALGDKAGQEEALIKAQEVLDALGYETVFANLQFSLIGGMANYKLNKPELARAYLENYVAIGGSDPAARIALAKTYADNRNFRGSIELVESLISEGRLTLELIRLAAKSYHSVGEHQKSVRLLERVTRALNNSTALNVQLALSRIKAGFVSQGLAELESLYINKDTRDQTALPLAVTYLDMKRFDKAHAIAQELLAGNPKEITYINLMGLCQVGLGDNDKAQESFSRILRQDPENVAANINLAKVDVRKGRFEPAIQRLTELAEADAENTQVMLELSRAYRQQGAEREALNWARAAHESDPQSLIVTRHFISQLLATDNIEDASKVGSELEQRNPENLDALEVIIDLLRAQNKTNQLRSHLRKMEGLAAENPKWLVKIANYQIKTGDLENAGYTLFKALQANPKHLSAQLLLTQVETTLGRLDSARERAVAVTREHPDIDAGYVLLGNILHRKQDYRNAEKQYIKANGIKEKTDTLLKLYRAQRNVGDLKSAHASLSNWLRKYPKDHAVRNALAEYYLGTESPAKAKEHYLMLVDSGIESPRLFNNIANTFIKLEDLESALDYAKRAYKGAPSDPFVNDTLGWALTLNNNYQEGIGYLREALARASTNPEIRYHLGANLAAQNRKKESISELKAALASNLEFEGKPAAKKLLKEVSRGR